MTTTSATQEGVQSTEITTSQTTDTPTEPVLGDREMVLQQIEEDNAARIVAEHKEKGIVIEGLTTPEEKPAETPPDDQLATQLEADKPTVLADGLDKVMVKVKIDGEEKEVSVADMQREFQKGAAADKRLDEASRLLREAREHAAALKSPPIGMEQKSSTTDITTEAAPTGDEMKALRKELRNALFEGDEERADAAMEKLGIGRPVPTQPDTKELATQLAPVLKQQLSAESALEKFQKDYQDIVSDPYLATVADGFLEAEAQDTTKSYAEALDAAGKRTRDWLATKTGTTKKDPPPTMDRTQKLERKGGIDNVPALNTKAANAEEPVPSASDTIAEMRKQRGLA